MLTDFKRTGFVPARTPLQAQYLTPGAYPARASRRGADRLRRHQRAMRSSSPPAPRQSPSRSRTRPSPSSITPVSSSSKTEASSPPSTVDQHRHHRQVEHAERHRARTRPSTSPATASARPRHPRRTGAGAGDHFHAPLLYDFATRAPAIPSSPPSSTTCPTSWRVVNTNDEVPKLPPASRPSSSTGTKHEFFFYEHIDSETPITFGCRSTTSTTSRSSGMCSSSPPLRPDERPRRPPSRSPAAPTGSDPQAEAARKLSGGLPYRQRDLVGQALLKTTRTGRPMRIRSGVAFTM